MIRLLEHEGKALLARNAIPIPRGGLYPDPPAGLEGELVVKAQVLAGGRGKAGGISFARNRAEVEAHARKQIGMNIGGAIVKAAYVEERLAIVQEYYLCAMVDRDLGTPVVMASPEGGVDIEAVAAGKILRRPIDPLLGLQPFVVDEIVRFLAPPEAARDGLRTVVTNLYRALISEDAELLEINPLALLRDGSVVAADAKCVLDEDAAYRHPARAREFDGTPFEAAARQLGTIGIEMQGNIAAIMNGAGMTMATLDQLIALGGKVRALVELHGAMAHGPERIAEIVRLAGELKPSVLLVNIFFQFRPLDTVAQGLRMALERGYLPGTCKVIARLRGEQEREARALLAGADCVLTTAFADACTLAVDHAKVPPRRQPQVVASS